MSFFRTYIDEPIQKELYNRIDSLNFQKSPQGLLDSVQSSVQHQFVKSCWARASVVLGDDPFTDEVEPTKVVQIGSFLDPNGTKINEPLNIKNGKSFRGRPGITSINSSFKEYFMKQSTVNFYIPDPKQFDEFKKQFLKFGRYMMVEWGWSLPYNLTLDAINATTVLKASKDIQERIRKGNGNYTALVGVVTNYGFNQTKEGAYEANVEISSMGRNVLGQKSDTDGKVENLVGYVNADLTKVDKGQSTISIDKLEIYKQLRKNFLTFNSVVKKLEYVVNDVYLKDVNKSQIEFALQKTTGKTAGVGQNAFIKFKADANKPGVFVLYKNINLFQDKDKKVFVTWGWFEDYILNSFFSFTSKDNEGSKFKTEFRSVFKYGEKNLNNVCGTHKDLYSLGFESIILPGKTKGFDVVDRPENEKDGTADQRLNKGRGLKALANSFKDYFKPFETDFEGKKRGQIRNMVFEVDYLIDVFGGTQNIEQKINQFWQKVSNDYGGFWRFGLVENVNIDGRMSMVDFNVGNVNDNDVQTKLSTRENPNQIFKFPLYSKDSFLSEIQLTSENSSEMATMAVYGSNVSLEGTSADMGKGYTSLAMRALSMLENNHQSEESATPNSETEKSYYDAILNNLTNPIYGNFLAKQKSEGTSATYDSDGNLESVSDDGGINFTDAPEILETTEKTQQNLTEQQKYDTTTTSIRKGSFWFDDEDKKVQIYSALSGKMYDEFKRTMLFNINKAPGTESNYSAVIPMVPLQLSLSFQGLGGIKVGDLFYIDYLPEKFRKYCHFMVVNVEHSVDTSGWTTKLDSRMIVDIPKLIDDKQVSQLTKFEPIIVTESLSSSVNEIQKEYEARNTKIDEERQAKINQSVAAKAAAAVQSSTTAAQNNPSQANPNPYVQTPVVGQDAQT